MKSGEYAVKTGYSARMEEEQGRERAWWWSLVWKLESFKVQNLLMVSLANKILTLDND